MKSEGEPWAVSSLTLREIIPQLKKYTNPLIDTGGGAMVSGEPATNSIELPADTDIYTFTGEYGGRLQIELQRDGTVFQIGNNPQTTTSKSFYSTDSGKYTYRIVVSSPSVTHGDPKPYTLNLIYTEE